MRHYFEESDKQNGLGIIHTRAYEELLALLIHGTCILSKAD